MMIMIDKWLIPKLMIMVIVDGYGDVDDDWWLTLNWMNNINRPLMVISMINDIELQ